MSRSLPLLLVVLLARIPATEEVADPFPPPSPAAVAEVLPGGGDDWVHVTLTRTQDPEERIWGYAQHRDGSLVVKPSRGSSTEERYPVADLASLEVSKQSSRPAAIMQRALRDDDFATALAVMAKVEEICAEQEMAIPVYVRYLDLIARTGQERLDAMLVALAQACAEEDPAVGRAALTEFIAVMDDSTIPDRAHAIVERGWYDHVARMEEAEREAWRETARGMNLRLNWDEHAPEYLAEARAAHAAEDWAAAARLYAKAIAAHAAWEEEDLLHLGESQLETGDRESARRTFWQLSGDVRNDPQHRPLFERAGITAPPLAPELLTLAYAGGTGDQCFKAVAFAADGTITASGSSGYQARFAADGTTFLGFAGDPNATCEDRGTRQYAVRLKRTNPHDGTEWKIGYKQVHGILQQPYLYSPHGWQWWNWKHADCEPRHLMADSRGIDIWFPTPEHFVAWTWSDGGNSSTDKDPRDLDRGLAATKGQYFGGGSKLLLGVQRTGEPLRGWNLVHRPNEIVMDDYGMFYIAGSPRVTRCQTYFDQDGADVLICDAGLEQKAKLQLGPIKVVTLAVHDNLLVMVGKVGRSAGTNKKGEAYDEIRADVLRTVNPIQQQPGGGADAVVAIVRLWKTITD